MQNGRYRTRSILISTREGQKVYSDPAQVPAELRRPLERALESELATTIIIADEKGRREAAERLNRALTQSPRPSIPFAVHAGVAGIALFLLWLIATFR